MAWLGTQETKVRGQHQRHQSRLPLVPCSLLTRADRWPLETRASMPIPLLLSLSADIARGSFSDRDKSAPQMHKHVKMRLFKTLFYYTGACSSDQEWVMSLGFGFEDGQVFINLHHFWPWPFTVMFFNFFAGTGLIDPHPTTHLKIGLPHAFQGRFY